MINILQINLRKSRSARRLMKHTARELQSDLLILSEIPRGLPDSQGWVSSSDGKSAVSLTQTAAMAATDSGKGPGFAFMQFPGLWY